MGTLTLSSLISRVQTFFAGRDDLTDNDIIEYLNLAQEQIAKVWDWEELDNTIEGNFSITASAATDKFLAMASTIKEVHSFRVITADGRSRKLRQMSQRMFDQEIPEPEFFARDIPRIYTLYNGKAELWPVPLEGYSYVIRTTNWPTAFNSSDLSATSDLDRKDLPLIYRASSIIWDSFGEYERSKRFYNIYASLIGIDVEEESEMPDRDIKPASEYNREGRFTEGKYWTNPFVKGL